MLCCRKLDFNHRDEQENLLVRLENKKFQSRAGYGKLVRYVDIYIAFLVYYKYSMSTFPGKMLWFKQISPNW